MRVTHAYFLFYCGNTKRAVLIGSIGVPFCERFAIRAGTREIGKAMGRAGEMRLRNGRRQWRVF